MYTQVEQLFAGFKAILLAFATAAVAAAAAGLPDAVAVYVQAAGAAMGAHKLNRLA